MSKAIGSKAQFLHWLDGMRNEPTRDRRLFIAASSGQGIIKVDICEPDSRPTWARFGVAIPDTKDEAESLWNSLSDALITEFHVHRLGYHTVLVAALNGLWDSLDARFLGVGRAAFQKVSNEEFESILGDEREFRRVSAEVFHFGISCRVIPQRTE